MQDMLPAAALEILDGAELQLVMAHAGTCPSAELLEEYRQVPPASLARRPAGQLDPGSVARRPGRLLARARADQRPAPTPPGAAAYH